MEFIPVCYIDIECFCGKPKPYQLDYVYSNYVISCSVLMDMHISMVVCLQQFSNFEFYASIKWLFTVQRGA